MVPKVVAVIPDGNGRWAEKRGLMREKGHFYGADNVPRTAARLFERGVETVIFYAMSEENFSRPKQEVEGILDMIAHFCRTFEKNFKGVSLEIRGNLSLLPQPYAEIMGEKRGEGDKRLILLVGYGGRSEIARAALSLPRDIGEREFSNRLSLLLGPEPDLIIRTGGEMRLSGFMPYASAYSELYFSKTLFPDFSADEVDAALDWFEKRTRRFGGI